MQLYLLGVTGSINLPYGSALVAFGQLMVMPAWLSHLPRARCPASRSSSSGLRTQAARRAANLSAPGSAG